MLSAQRPIIHFECREPYQCPVGECLGEGLHVNVTDLVIVEREVLAVRQRPFGEHLREGLHALVADLVAR